MARPGAPLFDLPLIPPGRRELGERWSASGVQMRIDGRSWLSEKAGHLLYKATATIGLIAALGLALANLPLPSEPAALSCTADTRWTQACREVGPADLEEKLDPPELARRMAANWHFERSDGLWRSGSIPYHLAQRAQAARDDLDPVARARVAAGLAGVLEAPTTYGGWVPDDAALAAEADAIASVYADQVDSAWVAHQAAVRVDHLRAVANRVLLAGTAASAVRPLFGIFLVFAGLSLAAALTRRRTERPFHLELGPHELQLEDTRIPMALIDRIDVRWGQLELGLRDGSQWVSRPLSPRNPARLELIVRARVGSSAEAVAEDTARERVHKALSAVLRRAEQP